MSTEYIEVTNKMVYAAIRQAVKDKILPTHTDMDTYIHDYQSVRRMLEKALEAYDK